MGTREKKAILIVSILFRKYRMLWQEIYWQNAEFEAHFLAFKSLAQEYDQ